MATPFADIVRAARDEQMDRSVLWYQRAIRTYARGVNTFQEAQQTDLGKEARQLEVGKMYMFTYDPKWKADLPYYDTVPLVIITEPFPGGFSGINLHYLPPMVRARLLDKLLPSGEIQSDTELKSAWNSIRTVSYTHLTLPTNREV